MASLISGWVWPRRGTEGPQLASMILLPSSRMMFIPLPATILAGREVKERWTMWELETNESRVTLMGIDVMVGVGGGWIVESIPETSQVRHESTRMDDVGRSSWRSGVCRCSRSSKPCGVRHSPGCTSLPK